MSLVYVDVLFLVFNLSLICPRCPRGRKELGKN